MSLRYTPAESLEFFVPLCEGERLRELRVLEVVDEKDPDEDRVLWTAPVDGDDSNTGRVLLDTETLAGLEAEQDQPLIVVASTTEAPQPLSSFTLSQLPTDGSAMLKRGGDDKVVDVAELVSRRGGPCGTVTPTTRRLVLMARIALGVGLVLGALVLWRRRAKARTAPPPSAA